MLRPFLGALAFAACLPCPLALAQAAPPPGPDAHAPRWPQADSDLPADPAVRFGTLPNGMRYAIMRNATPSGQTALRLRIGAGSLDESDAEQGLAHVLEHMAFKGSVHAPGGEMIKRLEAQGLSFGGDTNARTEQTQTVYQLDLPQSDAATVDLGLTFMRDIAGGLTLAPGALASERGVVLSEERLRDTPDYEVYKARQAFDLEGQLAADRLPIGKVEVIQQAPVSLVRRFYEAQYRPDNAVVVAVGDFDPDAMQAKIEHLFGDWRGVGADPPAPDLGVPPPRKRAFQVIVRKGVSPSIAIAWVAPRDPAPDSAERERRDLIEALGFNALNRRLARIAHAPAPDFLGAAGGRSETAHSARIAALQVLARSDDWRPALRAAVVALRQALDYGFTQGEIDREVVEYGVSLRNAAAGAATRRSPALAEEIVRSVDERQVDTAPDEDLSLYRRFTARLSAREVDDAFRRAFEGSGPLISLSTPRPEGDGTALAAAFAQAQAAPVTPPDPHPAVSWTHTRFGPPGRVAQMREAADLGVSFVRFENGVRLIVKPTALRKDQVQVAVSFGRGRLGEPKDRLVPDWAASALLGGGLDDLDFEGVQQALADKTVSAAFGVDDDAFRLTGATRPKDLDVQLQLLAAYMTAPGWRPEAFARAQALMALSLQELPATPAGVQARDLPILLHAGDRRWAYPDVAQTRAASLADLKALMAPELTGGPLEVVIVGDTTVAAAVDAVSRTFAALPPRPPLPPPPDAERTAFPAPVAQPISDRHQGRSDQASAYLAWPAFDMLSDLQRTRRLNVAAQVLQLRLIDKVRIAEGASYSPAAGAQESDVFPGYGYVYANVETPPARIDGFYADAEAIAADLAARPIGEAELQRAVRPRVEGIDKAKQTNGYWTAMLHDADVDPRRLDLIRTSPGGYLAVTAADVQDAARTYLRPAAAWRFVVLPTSPAPAQPGTPLAAVTTPRPAVTPTSPLALPRVGAPTSAVPPPVGVRPVPATAPASPPAR